MELLFPFLEMGLLKFTEISLILHGKGKKYWNKIDESEKNIGYHTPYIVKWKKAEKEGNKHDSRKK